MPWISLFCKSLTSMITAPALVKAISDKEFNLTIAGRPSTIIMVDGVCTTRTNVGYMTEFTFDVKEKSAVFPIAGAIFMDTAQGQVRIAEFEVDSTFNVRVTKCMSL